MIKDNIVILLSKRCIRVQCARRRKVLDIESCA